MGTKRNVIIYASSEESAIKKVRQVHNLKDTDEVKAKEVSKVYSVSIPNHNYVK